MTTYEVVARNFSQAHENKMHSDEVAQRYGFAGALVPGVAVYGHLTHPVVERFGEQWLERSVSSVRFLKPAYDGDRLHLDCETRDSGLLVSCRNDAGTLLAELHTDQPGDMPEPVAASVLDGPRKATGRVEITWEAVVENEAFEPWHWQITEDGNAQYAAEVADHLPVYRSCAHPHWLLSTANRALTREYGMPAWIHVGSDIRHRALLKVGDTVEVRAVLMEKWRKKGHEFLRLYVAYSRGHELTTEIFHTAIFKVAT
jgi:acyl dehydratase